MPLTQNKKSGLLIYGQIYTHQKYPVVELEILPNPIDLISKNPSPISLKADTKIGNVWDGANGEHIFTFHLTDLNQNGFFSLRADENTLISNFLYNPGDSLKIRFDQTTGTTVFSGPSAPFFEVQYLMKREKAKQELSRPMVFATDDKAKFLSNQNVALTVKESKTTWRKEITVLEQTIEQKNRELLLNLSNPTNPSDPRWHVLSGFKDDLKEDKYQMLQTWLGGTIAREAVYGIYVQILNLEAKNNHQVLNSFLSEVSIVLKGHLKEIPPIQYVQGNDPYLEFLYYAARIFAKADNKDWHKAILEDIPAPYRDFLLAKHLVRQKDLDKSLIVEWIPLFQNEEIRTFINNYLLSSNLGKIIDDAALQNSDLKPVRLYDYLGKWTLIDFWYTGCSACIKYYEKSLGPLEKSLTTNPDFQIISISVDKSPEKWLKSLEKGTYTSSHAINLFTAGEGHHLPWLNENNIFGYPSQILLSPDGIVVKNTGLNLPADALLELILSHINSINHTKPNHN
ncbi:TlpA family protein disulfide reductase [Aquiflexum balticum]|uniref:TlpA family protein disulfide reductase n=1 Tax=Aquiflexum balticum TaxID=280473 RepID=UPI001560A6C6|nr:redoxin domain-containing protein [Aquiflexum balticum]